MPVKSFPVQTRWLCLDHIQTVACFVGWLCCTLSAWAFWVNTFLCMWTHYYFLEDVWVVWFITSCRSHCMYAIIENQIIKLFLLCMKTVEKIRELTMLRPTDRPDQRFQTPPRCCKAAGACIFHTWEPVGCVWFTTQPCLNVAACIY